MDSSLIVLFRRRTARQEMQSPWRNGRRRWETAAASRKAFARRGYKSLTKDHRSDGYGAEQRFAIIKSLGASAKLTRKKL